VGGSMTDAMRQRASVADEAAEWLATLTDSACTRDEQQAFISWLRRSNLHVEEFLRISALTQQLTRLKLLPHEDIEELLRRTSTGSTGVGQVADISRRNKSDMSAKNGGALGPVAPRMRWMFAACAVIGTALLALATVRFDPFDWFTPTYSTSVGELRSITLADGSVVELNTQSSLRTRFTEQERRVELLQGEAMFRVAKNRSRPFRVASGSLDVVAVGTAFNVYQQSSRTVVTVLEGRVRVIDHTGPLYTSSAPARTGQDFELASGEQAVVAPHTPIARTSIADPRRVTAWTERRLIFDETPLALAAREFARYNQRTIRIEDPKLAQLHITGVFDATDPASLVQFVEAYGGISVRRDRSNWVLEGATPPLDSSAADKSPE
jgi:transmembrane sensor